jgi:serine protease inhibitor
MTQLRALGALLLAAALLTGCGGGGAAQSLNPAASSANAQLPTAVAQAQQAQTAVDPAIVAADNTLGLNLLTTLLPGDGGNVAISPLSVAIALQVLYNGAQGSTQQAMAQALDLGTLSAQTVNSDNAALQAALIDPDPKVDLTIANSLWLWQSDNPVNPTFTQTDETYYGATIGNLAGAPADVNAWVDTETHGLIPQILPPDLPPSAFRDAIIANALYFKGTWTTAFDPSQTAAAPFTLSDGTQASVPFMNQAGSFDYYAGTLGGTSFQALRIPYGSGRLAMLLVLPEPGADLDQFVAGITTEELDGWVAQLEPSQVSLSLPRFTTQYGTSLVPSLTQRGMGVAFGASADFSALAPNAYVSFIQHATVIEVDETGTVAAGATVIGVTDTIAVPTIPMSLNHPFWYAIQDGKTGELLFIGVMMNPLASGST